MPNTGSVRVSVGVVVVVIEPVLLFKMCWVTGLGQRSDPLVDVRRVHGGTQAGGAQANLLNLRPFGGSQDLADAPNAGTAMHSIDM